MANYERFRILMEMFYRQQDFFWQRFSGFATLHAGLFVLTTVVMSERTGAWSPYLIVVLSLALAVVWIRVHRLSLRYVREWKGQFHAARRRERFHSPFERKRSRGPASTEVALCVPYVVCAIWVVVLFLLLIPDLPFGATGILVLNPATEGVMCGLQVVSAWWSVIGVSIDIVGFWMIAIEWWLASRQHIKVDEKIKLQGTWGAGGPEANSVLDKAIRTYNTYRAYSFWTGVGLVTLGFGLQVVGNWPCTP